MNEVIESICNEIDKVTRKEYISLEIVNNECSIFNSKLGGIPYMMEESMELSFLGQINFEELPKLKGFPEKGILQFFISDDENERWGLGESNKYKVIYYENINYGLCNTSYNKNKVSSNFPVQNEYRLRGSKKYSTITVNDYRFNEVFMKIYRKYNNTSLQGYWEIPEINEDEIIERFSTRDIRFGGNPAFIQDDIRKYNDDLKDSILLFEIPSVTNEEVNISWGDSGIANFFIKEKDLSKRKFNDVLFYWDCY